MDDMMFEDTAYKKEEKENTVICAANSYLQKYYFNPDFHMLPESVKEELKIICVGFTESAGGILSLIFDKEGELQFKVIVAEGDYLFDEIESGILISEYQRKKRDVLSELELFYRVVFLGGELL